MRHFTNAELDETRRRLARLLGEHGTTPNLPQPELVPVAEIMAPATRPLGDAASLEALARDIRTHGLMFPLEVAPRYADDGPEWVLVHGHRRLAAVRALGWHRVAATVTPAPDDADNPLRLLAENAHRRRPTPRDEAAIFLEMTRRGFTHLEIAARAGVSPSTVYRRLKLTDAVTPRQATPKTSRAAIDPDTHPTPKPTTSRTRPPAATKPAPVDVDPGPPPITLEDATDRLRAVIRATVSATWGSRPVAEVVELLESRTVAVLNRYAVGRP